MADHTDNPLQRMRTEEDARVEQQRRGDVDEEPTSTRNGWMRLLPILALTCSVTVFLTIWLRQQTPIQRSRPTPPAQTQDVEGRATHAPERQEGHWTSVDDGQGRTLRVWVFPTHPERP